MIAFVRGNVASVRPTEAVLDVGGVGLMLHCTPGTTAELHVGSEAELAASLVVREDSLTLYGFATDDERTVFELLQAASGVGPRLAQAMLSVHTPDELRRALAAEDVTALTKVPGIGKKGAQRIVIELKDKLGPASGDVSGAAGAAGGAGGLAAPAQGWQEQVRSALLGLGWSARDADAAVERVAPMAAENGQTADVSALLKAALRTLAT
ncbi:Holliday junction branch migration protein RuvA [Actinobacteria bacterium YIM 96077]|uniref:Holliday junction branch migration complex subunit RuvA n=1 Tax=Phytoactinopolyspora halophila TaxID=1981511 RepID=A0A329QEX5_9ACTN|nr:Holliday junction branch migration protein RuvA [Phytoactinopolyspora halophila]AYY13467.1 Holliday junction branch migration protein RuvA [Actinobacteria bacterium YIM 96077]RAW10860.1 Holliday junction branch migration protein RuvA [Phytoactinopolyspora halophila]